jgi:hypothetical protein
MLDFISSAIQQVSSPFTSLLKVLSTSKEQANGVQNASPGDITVFQDAFLVQAYTRVIPPSTTKTPADFYRNGKPTSDGSSGYDYPPRFLEDQIDEPASIRLIGKNPANDPHAPSDLIPPYSKFFLESIQEPHVERAQIVETFGDTYVFFFGERPPIYTFSGTLLNSNTINWHQDFMFYYDNFFRGTK